MLSFILGLIVGGIIVKILDSRFHGNDEDGGRDGLFNREQSERKEQNLEKALEIIRQKGEVKNDDIQYALNVSDATATRYLDELEQQGKIEQIGTKKAAIYRIK